MTRDDYLILIEAVDHFPDLEGVLNRNGGANMTVCPECHVDDFTHVEGCTLAAEVRQGAAN